MRLGGRGKILLSKGLGGKLVSVCKYILENDPTLQARKSVDAGLGGKYKGNKKKGETMKERMKKLTLEG